MSKLVKFHFKSPDESPGFLLWQITMLWQRKVKRELDKIDITHTQFVLLATVAWLSNKKEVVTQIDIANHSKTDRMMVSKVLRTLQKKGYLTRKEHNTDTRAKVIKLTHDGTSLLQKAIKIVENVDLDFFSKLEDSYKTFNTIAQKLLTENL